MGKITLRRRDGTLKTVDFKLGSLLGFTWDDVDALEEAAMNADPAEGGKYIRLRNRIAALLPPRDDEA